MAKLVKVRLGNKEHTIRYEDASGQKLVRVTSHPSDAGKVLVWRKHEWSSTLSPLQADFVVSEASVAGRRIKEGQEVADLAYVTYPARRLKGLRPKNAPGIEDFAYVIRLGRRASVFHFNVEPRLRRKTLGTALVETLLGELKGRRIADIEFPAHKESGFYLGRGFRKILPDPFFGGYKGSVKKLGVKPKGIKLKVLWQRSRPRFA